MKRTPIAGRSVLRPYAYIPGYAASPPAVSQRTIPRPLRYTARMQLRGLARAGALFMVFSLAACSCGDDDGGKEKETDGTGDGSDSSVPIETDAGGKPDKPKKDAAVAMDAAMDAGMDADNNPFDNQDAEIVYTDAAAGPAPATWVCDEAVWNDGVCDCGCGEYDFDCLGSSCKEPGCVLTVPGCQACFNTEHNWAPCGEPPSIDDWTCEEEKRGNDTICDCGCGIPDPTCQGSGCTTEACYTAACERRHGEDDDDDGFADQLPNSGVPPAWTCAKGEYGSGDGCDCGCGVADPDCGFGPNCTAAKCTAASCEFCHDAQGRRLHQCAADLATWTCDPRAYGSGDGCDCGCGVADPDCAGDGCTGEYCRDNACKRCTDTSYGTSTLVGCAPLNATWTCDASHYGTGDGCDCGCGITDPDCKGAGCTTTGCTDSSNNKCDYCHDGPSDSPGDYVPCGGWTCGEESDPAWTGTECDCGCGKPDPACRSLDRADCRGAGCHTATCQYCNEGNATSRELCDDPHWSNIGYCNLSAYGLDGICDCGCGDIDLDCAAGDGCAAASCMAEGCQVCHNAAGQLIKCDDWACDESAYGDGETCNCGCGAQDPDCSNLGCKEPGCWRPGACDVCHDPYGRPTECP
jgi:hypothetical protein